MVENSMINYIITSINKTNNVCITHIYISIIFYTKKSPSLKNYVLKSPKDSLFTCIFKIIYNDFAHFNNKLDNVSKVSPLKFHFLS
jgi:hypothetical protein